MHDDEGVCGSSVVPHRGFSQKAREVLIGDDEMNHYENSIRGTPGRTLSDYELRKKMRMKKGSNNSSPKSESSSNSLGEQPVFDTIGEESRVKKHMRLSDIGKTRSCNELKTEKKARKGMQDDNVLKMPSIDSDIGSPTRSDGKPIAFDELCMEFYSMGQKSEYSTDEKNKKKLK